MIDDLIDGDDNVSEELGDIGHFPPPEISFSSDITPSEDVFIPPVLSAPPCPDPLPEIPRVIDSQNYIGSDGNWYHISGDTGVVINMGPANQINPAFTGKVHDFPHPGEKAEPFPGKGTIWNSSDTSFEGNKTSDDHSEQAETAGSLAQNHSDVSFTGHTKSECDSHINHWEKEQRYWESKVHSAESRLTKVHDAAHIREIKSEILSAQQKLNDANSKLNFWHVEKKGAK